MANHSKAKLSLSIGHAQNSATVLLWVAELAAVLVSVVKADSVVDHVANGAIAHVVNANHAVIAASTIVNLYDL